MGYILVIYYLDAPISIPFIILNTFITLIFKYTLKTINGVM